MFKSGLLIFLISFSISLLLVPLAKLFAHKLDILDKPDHRKIHKHPIPIIGGLPILIAFLTALFLFREKISGLSPVAICFIFVVFFGLVDDFGIKVKARYKILFHLLLSTVFIFFSGMFIELTGLGFVDRVFTICFITFMANSFNMLDGMDGLVSGVGSIAIIFFSILFVTNPSQGMTLFLLSMAILGAILGFLKYNFNPATIFLGESGSTLIGYCMAFLSIYAFHIIQLDASLNIYFLSNFAKVLIPLVILGIPIFDTYFVFINRFLNKIKFSQPGKDHSHHRISLMGFSQKETVLTLYFVQIILGSIAILLSRADIYQFFIIFTVLSMFVFWFVSFLLRVKVYTEK